MVTDASIVALRNPENIKSGILGTSKRAQWAKACTIKAENLTTVPGPDLVEPAA